MAAKKKKAVGRQPVKDCSDVATGIAKEVLLVGLHAVKELTGADLHYKPPKKPKGPWEKKWREK